MMSKNNSPQTYKEWIKTHPFPVLVSTVITTIALTVSVMAYIKDRCDKPPVPVYSCVLDSPKQLKSAVQTIDNLRLAYMQLNYDNKGINKAKKSVREARRLAGEAGVFRSSDTIIDRLSTQLDYAIPTDILVNYVNVAREELIKGIDCVPKLQN